MGVIYPTYERDIRQTVTREAPCCLCAASTELSVTPRRVRVRLNHFIPWGDYAETVVQCTACRLEYLASDALDEALIPSKSAIRLSRNAWLATPVPVLNLLLHLAALAKLPQTSNSYRQWAKIGLIPATLITVIVAAAILFSITAN